MNNPNTATAVRTIVNGVPVDDLFTTIEAIKATPAIAKFKFRVRNQWLDAAQNRSTVDTLYGARGHSDQAVRSRPGVAGAVGSKDSGCDWQDSRGGGCTERY